MQLALDICDFMRVWQRVKSRYQITFYIATCMCANYIATCMCANYLPSTCRKSVIALVGVEVVDAVRPLAVRAVWAAVRVRFAGVIGVELAGVIDGVDVLSVNIDVEPHRTSSAAVAAWRR